MTDSISRSAFTEYRAVENKTFIVTYDLNLEANGYQAAKEALLMGIDKYPHLHGEPDYLTTTTYRLRASVLANARSVYDHLLEFVDRNDELLVAEISDVAVTQRSSELLSAWVDSVIKSG